MITPEMSYIMIRKSTLIVAPVLAASALLGLAGSASAAPALPTVPSATVPVTQATADRVSAAFGTAHDAAAASRLPQQAKARLIVTIDQTCARVATAATARGLSVTCPGTVKTPPPVVDAGYTSVSPTASLGSITGENPDDAYGGWTITADKVGDVPDLNSIKLDVRPEAGGSADVVVYRTGQGTTADGRATVSIEVVNNGPSAATVSASIGFHPAPATG